MTQNLMQFMLQNSDVIAWQYVEHAHRVSIRTATTECSSTTGRSANDVARLARVLCAEAEGCNPHRTLSSARHMHEPWDFPPYAHRPLMRTTEGLIM